MQTWLPAAAVRNIAGKWRGRADASRFEAKLSRRCVSSLRVTAVLKQEMRSSCKLEEDERETQEEDKGERKAATGYNDTSQEGWRI